MNKNLRSVISCTVQLLLAVAMFYYPKAWGIMKAFTVFCMILSPIVFFVAFKSKDYNLSLFQQWINGLTSLVIAILISYEGHIFLSLYWYWAAVYAAVINNLKSDSLVCGVCNDKGTLSRVRGWYKDPDAYNLKEILDGNCPKGCDDE